MAGCPLRYHRQIPPPAPKNSPFTQNSLEHFWVKNTFTDFRSRLFSVKMLANLDKISFIKL